MLAITTHCNTATDSFHRIDVLWVNVYILTYETSFHLKQIAHYSMNDVYVHSNFLNILKPEVIEVNVLAL
jgi:hypothetical protein